MTIEYGIAYDLEPDDRIAEELGVLLDSAGLTDAELDAYISVMHKEPS